MKKSQQRFKLLLILLISIFAVIMGRRAFNTYLASSVPAVYKDVNETSINAITIDDGMLKQELSMKNGHWYVKREAAEFRADEDRISMLTKELTTFTRGDVVSTNKSKHALFGIDKRTVTFKDGSESHTLYFGQATASGTYARIGAGNEVFIAQGLSDPFVPTDYRDLTVPLIGAVEHVESVKITHGTTTLDLKKEKNDWKLNGKPAKKDRVEFFLNDLVTLSGTDMKTEEKKPSGTPEISVMVKEKGKEQTAMFYNVDETTYTGILSGNEKLQYSIAAVYVTSLKKEDKDFTE